MKGNICKRILAFTVALTMTASLNFTVIAQEISDLVNNQEAQVVSNVANEDVNEQTDITEDVCEVNGVKYPSFADALENAQDGDTIKLLADVEIAEAVKIQRDITINLNNKTMSLTRPDNYSIVIYDTLTIEGEGNVNCEGPYAIGLSTTCTGGLTVNGGTFTGSEDCVYMIGAFAGKVTINGGSFTTPYCVVNCFDGYETECEITDGEFEITGEENTLLLGHDIAVSGGTYNQPLSPDYCAEGFAPTYEDGVYTVMNEADAVCEVNGVSYPSFADALENAQDGDTIKLLADISLGETEITKNVTINGDGHTVTGTTEKTFRVFADASFENLTIVNSKANARCIDTREAVEVSIENCTLTTTSNSNNQPITIGGSENGTKLTITDTTISAGVSGYGIISFVESDVEITESTVEGYGAIYVKDGSDGSEYTITASTIKSTNVHSGETNCFGTIVIEAENVTINTVNSDIVADAQGDQPQVAISLGSMNGVALNMDKDSSIESNSGYLSGYEEGQTVSVPATVADKLENEGYNIGTATDGVVDVTMTYVTEVNGVKYPSFADALENAQNGDTIKLLADISLGETEITKNVTINGDDHTITGTSQKTFRVFANASFENLTIVNSKANARCIDTREAVEVSIINCTLTTTSKSNNQPITIGGSENGTKLTITDTTVSAGVSGYGIISFVESDVEITTSTVEGYGAIYVKDGSDGSEYTIKDSTIKSTNVHSGETNSFGTIVIEAENVTINTVNSDIVADAQGDQPQVAISLGSMSGVVLNMDKDSSIESNSGYLSGYEEGQTVSVPATVADKLENEGYATTDATDGVVNVDGYADVASFKGGSLRIWAGHYETADIRFRYIIDDKLPEGAEIVSWYWNYGVSEDNLAFKADGVNSDTLDGKTISNLVLTDVKAANYKNNIYTQLVVTYTIDGNEITVVDDQICSRNIYDIATAVVNDANASEAAKAYAEGLINYYAENVE